MNERRRVYSTPASDVRRVAIRWLLEGRIPFGYLSLLLGTQGLGKSTLLAWLAAANSRGEFGGSGVTLVCSAEDGFDTTVRPRLEAAGAVLSKVRFLEVGFADGAEGGLLLPDDITELGRELHDTEANLVTVDPILAHLGYDIDSHRDASTRQALAPLARLADESGAAIVAAHHLNKSAGTDPLIRASASNAFTGQARSVLLFARDPDDPDGETGSRRALAHVKSNLSALAPTQLWRIEPVVLSADAGNPEVSTSRVVQTGESAHTGRELLAAAGGYGQDDERSALEAAKDFLREELYAGPKPQPEVARDARGNGIADKTLQRASVELGVEKRKQGFNPSVWLWSLELSAAAAEDGQAVWPPSGNNELGHLRENPHEHTVSDTPRGAPNPEDGQAKVLAAFADSLATFGRPLLGEPGYPIRVDAAYVAEHITGPELRELLHLDALARKALACPR